MIHYPKKQPKKAAVTSLIYIACAAILYILGDLFAPRMVFQMIALIFIALSIYTVSRYLLTDYKYVLQDIDQIGGEVKFTIVRVTGKRENIMATFEMKDAYALEKCKSTKQFEKLHGKVNKVFNYSSNFLSDDIYKLAIRFNGMNVLFSLELSAEFVHDIDAVMVKNDENIE